MYSLTIEISELKKFMVMRKDIVCKRLFKKEYLASYKFS